MKRLRTLPLLCLLLTPAAALAQGGGTGRIEGMVIVGSTGQPLPGASVMVQGTRIGVLAGPSGRYVLTGVPLGSQTVQATLLGHTSQAHAVTVTAGATASANFQLEVEAVQLAGIVAVGYGTQSRRTLTGSVAQIRPSDITELTTSNPLDALRGRLPGVDIVALTNDPGGAVRIRIQGARSIRASNDPLLVIDGVPTAGDLRDIDPHSIQSIDVLKDAAATVVYGSRGANGVLLVTTKGGIAGRTRIDYGATYGVSSILRKLDLWNGQQYANWRREFGRAQSYPACADYPAHLAACDSAALDAKELAGLAAGVSTDWQDLVLRQGALQNQQLSISGGDERTRFRAALGFLDQTAITITQGYTGKNASLNAAHDFGRLELRASVNAARLLRQVGAGGGIWGQAVGNKPLGRNKDDQGNDVFFPTESGLLVNPVVNAHNNVQEITRTSVLGSLEGALELVPGLRLHVNFGPQYAHVGNGYFVGTFTALNRGDALPVAGHASTSLSDYTVSTFLDLDRRIAGGSRIQGTLLYELAGHRVEWDSAGATGLPYSTQLWYDLHSGSTYSISSSLAESRLQSYMGRVNYTLEDRYTLSLSGRVDGSSVLAPGHKYAFFPAAAIGWQLGDESFMRRLPVISDLKLRLSYGRVGNSAIDPYETLGTLTQAWYPFGTKEQAVLGYGTLDIPNPDLRWETTDKYNLGLDFGLFGDRVTGALDAYQAHTHDLLLLRALPYTTGYLSVLANVGATRNRGIEALLTTRNLQNWRGLSWSTDVTFSLNRNRIVSLAGGMQADVGSGRWVGQPIDVYYDYKMIGIWQTADTALARTMGSFKPGDTRVADIDGDGKITTADRTFIGNHYNFPRWQGSVANRFAFRNFDASVLATARWGFTVPDGFMCSPGDYWTPEHASNECPRPGAMNTLGLGYGDGSYVRIRDITLGYTLPPWLLRSIGSQRTRMYVRAQDPFLFTRFVGWDPEAGASIAGTGGAGVPGSPAYRTLLLGVDASF